MATKPEERCCGYQVRRREAGCAAGRFRGTRTLVRFLWSRLRAKPFGNSDPCWSRQPSDDLRQGAPLGVFVARERQSASYGRGSGRSRSGIAVLVGRGNLATIFDRVLRWPFSWHANVSPLPIVAAPGEAVRE